MAQYDGANPGDTYVFTFTQEEVDYLSALLNLTRHDGDMFTSDPDWAIYSALRQSTPDLNMAYVDAIGKHVSMTRGVCR